MSQVILHTPTADIPIHWITSDHHLGHINISKLALRPFDNTQSTEHMDDTLLAEHNALVKPHENVLILGDVALGKIDVSLAKWGLFNGNKFLVPGNHDRISSAYHPVSHQTRFLPLYQEHFTVLPETVNLTVAGQPMLASHYPYVGDHQDIDRYKHLRAVDEGLCIIHGHTHAHVATKPEHPRMYHVGVDAHDYKPVSADTIVKWARHV